MSPDIALQACHLNFSYKRPIVRDFSLQLPCGEITGMIGPNGSGKTTILRLLAGILKPSSGTVLLTGNRSIAQLSRKEIARQIAVVPQSNGFYPYQTVFQVTLLGRSPHLSLMGFEGDEDIRIAREALEHTQLTGLSEAKASEISGGEKQRLLLARALAQQPKILMLDELTANLDINFQVELMRMVARITKERNLATLIVSHEINLLAAFCHQGVLIADGSIRHQGPVAEVVTGDNLRDLFGMNFSVQIQTDGTPEILPIFAERNSK